MESFNETTITFVPELPGRVVHSLQQITYIDTSSMIEPITFDTALQEFYVTLEELRLSLSNAVNHLSQSAPTIARATSHDFIEFIQSLGPTFVPQLGKLSDELHVLRNMVLCSMGQNEDSTEGMILDDCCRKARCEAVSCLILSTLCHLPESIEEDTFSGQFLSRSVLDVVENYNGPLPDGLEVQSSIANLTEVVIILCSYCTVSDEILPQLIKKLIIPTYTNFQRQCLRTRSKPSIKNLVNIRRTAAKFSQMSENDDDDEDIKVRQPHVHALTCILSEASVLLQPIRGWFEALSLNTDPENEIVGYLMEMLKETSSEIDEEAQDLSSTVGSWFSEDRDVKQWVSNAMMQMSANPQQNEGKQGDIDVTGLDNVLEELAFVCQVSARYCEFFNSTKRIMGISNDSSDNNRQPLWLLLQEHSGQYAILEDCLSKSSLDRAIDIAAPVEISDKVFVPSVVEDAFFVSRRSVERSASTFNSQALMTLANRIAEAWGQDGGIYRALIDNAGSDHKNPNVETLAISKENPTANDRKLQIANNESFTNAFLDAIDDDVGIDHSSKTVQTNSSELNENSLPKRIGLRERRLLGSFCALNGITSAASASSALSALFNEIVENKSHEKSDQPKTGELVILKFARDELRQHASRYEYLLIEKTNEVIEHWCGSFTDKDSHIDPNISLSFPAMQTFIRNHIYELDANGCQYMESDDILDAHLIAPLRSCDLFKEVQGGRCEPKVSLELAKSFASAISAMLFSEIVYGKKSFTDWGALVLSKQIRLLQNLLCSLIKIDGAHGYHQNVEDFVTTAPILSKFERISQACSILQLEKPSDWTTQRYGDHSNDKLSTSEIREIMYQRVDFSRSIVDNVCKKLEQ